jgi:hypothetical protein
MLCSHSKRFLYFKTKKTAGTSVEIYFEPHCLKPGSWRPEHARTETVSAHGIIGSRMGGRSGTDIWFNHMPAVLVREHIGHDIFNAYYKFCVIRNPYDKMVSRFWWNLRHSEDERRALLAAPFAAVTARFRKFLLLGTQRFADDRDVYSIGGEAVMDRFIRYECLHEDLQAVCTHLGLPYAPERLGTYKSGFNTRPEHFSEYYDPPSRKRIEAEFDWEIERFDYRLK